MRTPARLALLALLAASGCKLDGSCRQSNVPGVEILVEIDPDGDRDARNVVATLNEGSYLDTMQVTGVQNLIPIALGGAFDRPGSYNLCVKKPGFDDFAQNAIFVGTNACGITSQVFTVRLKFATGALPC